MFHSDLDSEEQSSESSSSDSSSSESDESTDDEVTYRRGRNKKRSQKKRRKRYRSRSRDRTEECKRRRRRRSRSKSKKRKSMKAILHELAELKKQMKKDKNKGIVQTPGKGKVKSSNNESGNCDTLEENENDKFIKSPSDTAVYAPAVMKEKEFNSPSLPITKRVIEQNQPENISVDNASFINQFLNNMRLTGGRETSKVRSEVKVAKPAMPGMTEEERKLQREREKAQHEIAEAEKYNATVNPMGMSYYSLIKSLNLKDPDEEYFHIICHVENTLKDKIKKGQFVELEKLLKRNKLGKTKERWQMGRNSEGYPVWEPCDDKETRITNIYRWDQAFRVYATIYSKENPARAAEIWQYIESIHNAAKIYCWDNVANYDYCFRQLMSDNPDRSWAKPYLQMWTTTLCEPYSRSSSNKNDAGGRRDTGNKSNYCWRYNKNKCNNPHCRFEHKCSYCGGFNHQYINCYKRSGNKRKGQDRNESDNKSPSRKVVRK